MKDTVIGNLLRVVPKNWLSWLVGHLVHLRLPGALRLWALSLFARRYRLNLDEAEKALEEYLSIGDLFTRRLKPGLRPLGPGFVHPVDGRLTLRGWIHEGQLIQAKGLKYPIGDFLKEPAETLKDFEGGKFITYYLCPTDYHRVHSPVSGRIKACTHIPGRLWPVNPWSVAHITQLFAVNERVIVWIEDRGHRLALVFVGATNVGKMTMSFDPLVVTNRRHWRNVLYKTYDPPISVAKGDELGIFNMGSTVIVVAPKGYFEELCPNPPYAVRMGESLFGPPGAG